jgi:hypothetical protein
MCCHAALRPPWLFLLVFLAYLLGPVRAETGPPSPSRLGPAAASPFAALVRTVYPAADPSDRALWSSRLTGAAFTAAAVAVAFSALGRLTTPGSALVLALLAGFASPLWSHASRSATPLAPAALAVSVLLWRATRAPGTDAAERSWDLLSGALGGALVLLDPTHPVSPLLLVALVRARPWTWTGVGAALVGALGAATAVAALPPAEGFSSLTAFSQVHDSAHPRFGLPQADVLAALLVSPGRGLVFHVPLVALAAAAVVLGREPRWLVRGAALALAVALAESASLDPPWGVDGFGPVSLSAFVPVLAAAAATLPAGGIRWGALFPLPAALAHAGAVFLGGHTWHERRDPVADPAAVWDVRDSPFSDVFAGPPRPDLAALVPAPFAMTLGEHPLRAGAPRPWLLHGWEAGEPTGTWASGPESWIAVAVPPGSYTLTLRATAPRSKGRPQRLLVHAPGAPAFEVTFGDGLWNEEPIAIRFRPSAGVSLVKIRPGHTWRPGRGDVRNLSLFVTALWLEKAMARP